MDSKPTSCLLNDIYEHQPSDQGQNNIKSYGDNYLLSSKACE